MANSRRGVLSRKRRQAPGRKHAEYRRIVLLIENIRRLFAHDRNVFVAGDLLWYPVEGRVDISLTPDCLVAFGPPQRDRRSYKQWVERTPPQVVLEVLSPSNTPDEMMDKLRSVGID